MLIPISDARIDAVFRHLAASEDAESLNGGGYACDLYELDPPVALEVYPAKGGLDVAAAFILNYDEALGGHYLGEKLETPEAVLDAIRGWAPLGMFEA